MNIPKGCKPFNLEEALNGADVVTRDGRPATQITFFDVKNIYLVRAVLDGSLCSFTEDGLFINKCISNNDLFIKTKTKTVFTNLYFVNNSIVSGGLYDSMEEALCNKDDVNTYIKTIELEIPE